MDIFLERLRASGLKLTPRRRAIIETFIDRAGHLSPHDVWQRLRRDFTRCGLPSVYRNLESLAECGILTRIQQFDRKKHYALCPAHQGRHHHHITCINCGKVDMIEECAFANKKRLKGYRLISHYVQINGICADCARG